jgi:hypothetical protein
MRRSDLFLVGLVLCFSSTLTVAQDGYFANWFARVDKTKDEQPHWVTPLATTTPRLEEEYRYDQLWQTNAKGITTNNCCGNTERGLPEVPVEWLKSEWRNRGLLKRVQLTISGCVGPCDVPNVVVITSSSGTEWLGNIVKFDQYRSLLEWAVRCRDASEMLPATC